MVHLIAVLKCQLRKKWLPSQPDGMHRGHMQILIPLRKVGSGRFKHAPLSLLLLANESATDIPQNV